MYYDSEHDPAIGCLSWIVAILIVAIIAATIIHAMATDDPPGRCAEEPGPNNITISTCEGD